VPATLLAMRLTKFGSPTLACLALAPLVARAEVSAELLDLAARVQYGYYQADARAIEAAQVALDRLGDSADAIYYRDFAALRLAQVGGRDDDKRLSDCARREAPAELTGRAAAEAAVLAAACALAASDNRRFEQALARARALDDDHPRIALLEAWALERRIGSHPEARAELEARLTAAVAAFDAWTPTIDDPAWGQAEALAALGESALARGDVRAARDLLERALLLAPDYTRAVALRTSVLGARGSPRTL
jgi:tetratricopeptide (TPR) repeat protein